LFNSYFPETHPSSQICPIPPIFSQFNQNQTYFLFFPKSHTSSLKINHQHSCLTPSPLYYNYSNQNLAPSIFTLLFSIYRPFWYYSVDIYPNSLQDPLS